MAALVQRIEWNSRAAALIALLLFGTLFACAPVMAQDEEEEDAVTPMTGCAQRDRPDATMIERMRRRLSVTTCASSAWLDSLGGDEFRYDQYRATYGTISAGGLWSDYDGFDPRLRFRMRLKLPQWDERISAFAGRDSPDPVSSGMSAVSWGMEKVSRGSGTLAPAFRATSYSPEIIQKCERTMKISPKNVRTLPARV